MANARTRTITQKSIRFADWPRGWKPVIVDIPAGLLATEVQKGYHTGKYWLRELPENWKEKYGALFFQECRKFGVYLEINEVQKIGE